MFTDVSISTSLNKEFLDFIQSKENVELGVNFSIMVLQVIFSSPEPKTRVSFPDHNLSIVHCPSSRDRHSLHSHCFKLFTFSSSPEPLGQFQPNFAQNLIWHSWPLSSEGFFSVPHLL